LRFQISARANKRLRKAAEGSRTPRRFAHFVSRTHRRQGLERGCPLCTLHGSFISNAEVCWTTHSPHPGPLPEEREKHRPTLEHCQDIRFADRLATILPLPGERAGVRGNGLRMVQLAPVQEMRVMCSALCRFRFRQYRTLRWRNFVNRGCS